MTDGGGYVPVHRVRCGTCGGASSVIGCADPRGEQWACPHHGVGDDDQPFHRSGVGEIGQDFEYIGMVVVRASDPKEIQTSVDILEQDFERADALMFRDYEAVDIRGVSGPERARERDVGLSTIRESRRRARGHLCGGGDD